MKATALRIAVVLSVALVKIYAAPAPAAAAGSCFDRDLADWETSVDYRKALASETLAPERVRVNGRTVSTGLSEASLEDRLGSKYRVVEDWSSRDAEQQCEYLNSLARAHSNSMHYYILTDRHNKRLSGSFRTCEWAVAGVGQLRAFLHRPNDSPVAHAWLLHLTMDPVPEESVSYSRGPSLHLIRNGPPKVEWDVTRNSVLIEQPAVSAPDKN